MMQDEVAEIQVRSTLSKEPFMAASRSFFSEHSEEGPDDEFRPVEDTRDEGNDVDSNDNRMASESERETDQENVRDEEDIETRQGAGDEEIEVSYSYSPIENMKQDDDNQSLVSALGKSQEQPIESEGDKIVKPIIDMDILPQNTGVSLFDASLLDDASDDSGAEEDDLSVVSKSVVDESSKNVEEAEALAKEMKRQLAESLAEFSNSPKPSIDDDLDNEIEKAKEKKGSLGEQEMELPTPASPESQYYSKNKVLKLVGSLDENEGSHRIELPSAGSIADSASVVSSSSSVNHTASVPLRRPRSNFRQRRPSISSWATTDETADTSPPRTVHFLSTFPVTQQQQRILETVVIPAVFLLVAVAICRTFFHPWLKVGNDQSNTWALTWTILCIVAVVAPVCALEYMLLGGLLAGTVVQEALAKYPEVKLFLKDVRRMRLKAGWWYPSEVRALRKDLEAKNADNLLKKQESIKSQIHDSEEDADVRSIQRTMSREEQRREKSQLEKAFDSERAEWFTVKEQLMAESYAEQQKSAKLQHQLDAEQLQHKQVAAQKEQLENNIEVERAQWKFTRVSLEDALKTAVDAVEDSTRTHEFFAKMEEARDEERNLWEKEREGFQATIRQSEEDAQMVQKEHEAKLKQVDEMVAMKQSKWDEERKSLQEEAKNATSEAKAVKDSIESQICQMMDANDAQNESEIRTLKTDFMKERMALEQMMEEAKKEQHVSLQCVSNLQALLEEERAEWESSKTTLAEDLKSAKATLETSEQKLAEIESNHAEERTTWETTRKTFEDAVLAATSASKKAVEQQDTCVTTVLRQELKSKESKIKALEVSIQQLESIVSVQETTTIKVGKGKADREAEEDGESVHSAVSDASTYYSWVQKVQETHGKEQRQMLKGLLTQHIRWQTANHHVRELLDSSRALLEASESIESSETFQECLLKHTETSVSAKKYMDDVASSAKKTQELPESLLLAVAEGSAKGTKDSEASEEESRLVRMTNPWSKNAPLWEQIWARTGNPKTVAKTICSGIVVGTGVGLGLFHLRSMKQKSLLR